MDSIILRIRVLHQNKNLAELLWKMKPVENVQLNIEAVDEFRDIYGQDYLLISDDVNALKPYFSKGPSHINIIYAGTPDEINTVVDFFPQNIVDLWPGRMIDEFILFKLNRAVTTIITKYNAWLYKTWLYSLMDSLQDLVWFKDAAGLHWLVNDKFEDTVHKTRDMVHGKGHNYIWDVPPEDGGKSEYRCLESEREVMEKETLITADELVKTDAGMRHFITYKSPLYGRDGEVMGTVGIGHDITDFNNTSIELEMLIDNIPLAVVICDKDWNYIQSNSRYREVFMNAAEHLDTFNYNEWKKSVSQVTKLRHYKEASHLFREELIINLNGKDQIFMVTEKEIFDYFGNVTGYYCFYRNVTSEREYEEVILKYANTDSLTGLYNRRYFFDYIYNNQDLPMTVLLMDMDNFKRVNDTFGHTKGDSVLKETSEIIKKYFPESLIARLGGDEFAVVADEDFNEYEIKKRTNEIIKEIEASFAPMNLGVSISIGTAYADGIIKDIDAFIHESDQMMYRVKQAKKRA